MSRMATLIVHPWYLHTLVSFRCTTYFFAHNLTVVSCLVRLHLEADRAFTMCCTLIDFAARSSEQAAAKLSIATCISRMLCPVDQSHTHGEE